MTNKHLFTFLFFITLCCTSIGQNQIKIDSLLNAYQNQKQDSSRVKTAHAIYDAYCESQPKLALKYSVEGLGLSKKIKFKKGIVKSFHHIGRHFMIKRQLDSSKYYLTKSKEIFEGLDNKHQVGLVAYDMIRLSYVSANYNEVQNHILDIMERYTNPVPDSIIIMKLNLIRAKAYILIPNRNPKSWV